MSEEDIREKARVRQQRRRDRQRADVTHERDASVTERDGRDMSQMSRHTDPDTDPDADADADRVGSCAQGCATAREQQFLGKDYRERNGLRSANPRLCLRCGISGPESAAKPERCQSK